MKKTDRASDVYFDALNVGLNPLLNTQLGIELILQYNYVLPMQIKP